MLKEKILDGINPGDRVFEVGRLRVKVRLQAEALAHANKIFGPAAYRVHLTAAVCDENGKAIPRADGAYCIFPHTITLAGLERGEVHADPFAQIEPVLEDLVARTLAWHQGVENVERFVNKWRSRAVLTKKRKAPARKTAKTKR